MIFPAAPHPLNNTRRRLDEPEAVAPGFSSISEVVYGGWFLILHIKIFFNFFFFNFFLINFLLYYMRSNGLINSRLREFFASWSEILHCK